MTDQKKTGGYFEHEKLDVYKVALELLRWVKRIEPRLAGRAWLKDQLLRSASSVVLNVAEGAHQTTIGAKRRHYRVALASSGETAGALDVAEVFGVDVREGRPLNARVAAMLRRMT